MGAHLRDSFKIICGNMGEYDEYKIHSLLFGFSLTLIQFIHKFISERK